MCLVRWWNSGFFTRRIAPSLSHRSGVEPLFTPRISVNSERSQTASFVDSQAAINSASVVDRDTQRCSLLVQEKKSPGPATEREEKT